jgi:hypothetical protein
MGIGWSNPYLALNTAQVASVAFSPRRAMHGSPGRSRVMTNTEIKIPKITGRLTKSRRTM